LRILNKQQNTKKSVRRRAKSAIIQ